MGVAAGMNKLERDFAAVAMNSARDESMRDDVEAAVYGA